MAVSVGFSCCVSTPGGLTLPPRECVPKYADDNRGRERDHCCSCCQTVPRSTGVDVVTVTWLDIKPPSNLHRCLESQGWSQRPQSGRFCVYLTDLHRTWAAWSILHWTLRRLFHIALPGSVGNSRITPMVHYSQFVIFMSIFFSR